MKNILTRIATIVTAIVIALTIVSPMTAEAAAFKANPKLNKTKVTLAINNIRKVPSVTLKIKNVNSRKAVKWETTNKNIVTIKTTGK